MFATRCIDRTHGQIVRLCRRTKCNRGKDSLVAALVWRRDELNDLGTHESPSHTAIAIKPTREKGYQIRGHAGLTLRHQSNMRHDRVPGDHFRREPYPSRP